MGAEWVLVSNVFFSPHPLSVTLGCLLDWHQESREFPVATCPQVIHIDPT